MSIQHELRHAKRQTMERLVALRDEAKLQLHLLSLDARERWNALEKEIGMLEERANRGGEKVSDAVEEAAQELASGLRELMASEVNHSAGLLTNTRSLMSTSLHSCGPDDSLARAAQLMWENDCGAVTVVVDSVVVGIITDRDVCMATYTQGKAPSELVVGSAMSRELFSCGPDESIGDVLAIMADKRVRRVPVVGASGKLLGVIALADIARWANAIHNPTVEAALTETLAAISALPRNKLAAAAE